MKKTFYESRLISAAVPDGWKAFSERIFSGTILMNREIPM